MNSQGGGNRGLPSFAPCLWSASLGSHQGVSGAGASGEARYPQHIDEENHAMASSLIHGKYVICKVHQSHRSRGDRGRRCVSTRRHDPGHRPIRGAGAQYQPDESFGSPSHVVMPGLVNSHHHVGLTPFQLGSPDYPLELWFASRMAARTCRPVSGHAIFRFRDVESGITTVQHLHGWRGGPVSRVMRRRPSKSSRRTRTSVCECPTPMRCATRTGSSTRLTRTLSDACQRSLAPDLLPICKAR